MGHIGDCLKKPTVFSIPQLIDPQREDDRDRKYNKTVNCYRQRISDRCDKLIGVKIFFEIFEPRFRPSAAENPV